MSHERLQVHMEYGKPPRGNGVPHFSIDAAGVVWRDPSPMTLAGRADAMAKFDRAIELGLITGLPQRYIAGIDPAELRGHRPSLVIYDEVQHFQRETVSRWFNTKEAPMTQIDQTQFVARTNAQKVKAEALAAKHLGSLVTITLPSGAEITDILDGVHVGRLENAANGMVVVVLANVGHGFDVRTLRDCYGEHRLDPSSVVHVRRRRTVAKGARK